MAKSRDFILQHTYTSQIKQTSVCHADTIHLLHVAYTEQSAHQICRGTIRFTGREYMYLPE